MSLRRVIAAGVKTAIDQVRDLMQTVDWTFVSSDPAQYDPSTDSYTKNENTRPRLQVLIWNDKDDDTQMMFSSRGNFVESPTEMDTLHVLIEAASIPGLRPSTRDHFVWDGETFGIDSLERVPGDSVFIMRASRT